MGSLKHLGLPIMAAGLKEGDEVMQEKRDGCLRTFYLQGHRLIGFQLVGGIRSAGIFRSLMLRGTDLRLLKHRLLDPDFGEGTLVWHAMA